MNIEAPRNRPAILATTIGRWVSIRLLTRGWLKRRSISTKTAKAISEPISMPITGLEPQPHVLPCDSGISSSTSATPRMAAPTQSTRPSADGRRAGITSQAPMRPIALSADASQKTRR